jgi:hypothetical protein
MLYFRCNSYPSLNEVLLLYKERKRYARGPVTFPPRQYLTELSLSRSSSELREVSFRGQKSPHLFVLMQDRAEHFPYRRWFKGPQACLISVPDTYQRILSYFLGLTCFICISESTAHFFQSQSCFRLHERSWTASRGLFWRFFSRPINFEVSMEIRSKSSIIRPELFPVQFDHLFCSKCCTTLIMHFLRNVRSYSMPRPGGRTRFLFAHLSIEPAGLRTRYFCNSLISLSIWTYFVSLLVVSVGSKIYFRSRKIGFGGLVVVFSEGFSGSGKTSLALEHPLVNSPHNQDPNYLNPVLRDI